VLHVNIKINDIYNTLNILKLMMHNLSKLYTRERISSFEANAYKYHQAVWRHLKAIWTDKCSSSIS